jgi:hypothetical protein
MSKQVCKHLLGRVGGEFYRYFTGDAKHYSLLCPKCKNYAGRFALDLEPISDDDFHEHETHGSFSEFIGEPEIVERASSLRLVFDTLLVPSLRSKPVAAMAPIISAETSQWVVFDVFGGVHILDLHFRSLTSVGHIPMNQFDPECVFTLRVSPKGDYAVLQARRYATGESSGSNRGAVIDLNLGEITMQLDRGDYYTEMTELSAEFFTQNDQTLLVHATDWNRLDISNPATGECLTERDFEARPSEAWRFNQSNKSEFTGALTISPDQQWIVDHGWVWSPMGNLSSWNLPTWLETNKWEADNGPSKVSLYQRAYFWDGPACWVDNHTLCVWGYGTDSDNIIPAAVLFDARNGKMLDWFPGPQRGLFVFDKYLYTTDQDQSFSVWDVHAGERVFYASDFAPHFYHPSTKQFIALKKEGVFDIAVVQSDDSAVVFN